MDSLANPSFPTLPKAVHARKREPAQAPGQERFSMVFLDANGHRKPAERLFMRQATASGQWIHAKRDFQIVVRQGTLHKAAGRLEGDDASDVFDPRPVPLHDEAVTCAGPRGQPVERLAANDGPSRIEMRAPAQVCNDTEHLFGRGLDIDRLREVHGAPVPASAAPVRLAHKKND
jgi:hypothetical protein